MCSRKRLENMWVIEERGKNKIGDQYGISIQNKTGMMRDSVNAIKNKSQYTAEK